MDYAPSPRTTPTRNPARVSYDRTTAHAVLDEAVVCHVGFVVDGRPVVLPQLHARVDDTLYLHGSTGARALLAARDDGLDVCVTVTLVDGLVLARSAFHHSVNYRSVVVHGTAHVVTDPAEKSAALDALVDAVVPGRAAGTRAPDRRELAATTVLRLPLTEVSVKVRSGPPSDDAADLDGPHWAGVLPLTTVPGAPVPAPDLAPGIGVPDHVTGWGRSGS
ncbi:pyridoxamine 5'-phosphate oxidase family protein [Geodermatophilus sabuli]|uniref:Nitroimidazol reductase NimA, pyridoxamine 5'-phosphate oxidase superfamily n=1 Tax=Geodermatophilus sabuli TaxID=1564158 RepID=A0A285E5K4_9ACTN|nr:pyridoxamine 5'-phosphate oxidase family protein [Geodermatophilus sabuli]MBB3082756.1 nitroimidazol reductase NimA-like FMN-containing flavoprotein (pyridoxamine 5'-phosphate oxidase superfamily) [Geodermatophilus sabuli]SNX94378.1 Nitroimidazol reductase NimA, pyridoxamine 5'-phosphate oxidase superfamily [Geodermatophilus sabuli]